VVEITWDAEWPRNWEELSFRALSQLRVCYKGYNSAQRTRG
jgi:hypothetical protein